MKLFWFLKVLVGQVACNVTLVKDDNIYCILNEDSAGLKPVVVKKINVGVSNSDILFNYTFSVNEVYIAVNNLVISGEVPEGSYIGGNNLTVTGFGFSNTTQVLICDVPCQVVDVSSTKVVCNVPKLNTVSKMLQLYQKTPSFILNQMKNDTYLDLHRHQLFYHR